MIIINSLRTDKNYYANYENPYSNLKKKILTESFQALTEYFLS